jgi:hypothetical protein
MKRPLLQFAWYGSTLTVAAVSGIGLAVAVEGPPTHGGVVERLAATVDLSGARLGRTATAGAGFGPSDRSHSFAHSSFVLPLLVGDLASASAAPPRTPVGRTARIRPPMMTVPFASR